MKQGLGIANLLLAGAIGLAGCNAQAGGFRYGLIRVNTDNAADTAKWVLTLYDKEGVKGAGSGMKFIGDDEYPFWREPLLENNNALNGDLFNSIPDPKGGLTIKAADGTEIARLDSQNASCELEANRDYFAEFNYGTFGVEGFHHVLELRNAKKSGALFPVYFGSMEAGDKLVVAQFAQADYDPARKKLRKLNRDLYEYTVNGQLSKQMTVNGSGTSGPVYLILGKPKAAAKP